MSPEVERNMFKGDNLIKKIRATYGYIPWQLSFNSRFKPRTWNPSRFAELDD